MWLIDRRYFRYFDWLSFILITLLSAIGLSFVWSATFKHEEPFSLFFKKQVFGFATGFGIYFLCCCIDYRSLQRWGYFLYFATIVLLLCTIIKGSIGMGAQRWINLGIFKFQPSELTKLFFPAFVSYYLYTEKETGEYTLQTYTPLLIILGLSFLLIAKQPDLGTAIIIALSGLLLLWLSGLTKKFFLVSFTFFIVSAPTLWHFLKPYQKKRISVFLGEGDKRKERYQIEQSKIAIGSGGLSGKGFLQGTQNKLLFLPEGRTDFIFSVICEEWGFVGACCILFLYTLFFLRLIYVITTIPHFFGQLFAAGLSIPIMLSTLINIGMVMGMFPVVGIPLPLISYGITQLWITLASLGCFNSIAMRRFYSKL